MLPQPVPRQVLHGTYGFNPVSFSYKLYIMITAIKYFYIKFLHKIFFVNAFSIIFQQLHPNLVGPQFLRPDHMMPAFPSNQTNQQHQHSYSHLGNQRNQNRPYYHNEQQTGHQPFFKNNQYPHRNHDRNNQRSYQHYSHSINGNASGEYEHSGKLAIKAHEKQWLINIQLLQLNTIQPYVDDHYYIVFCDKQNKQHANQEQKDKKHHNNNGYHKDHRYVFCFQSLYFL